MFKKMTMVAFVLIFTVSMAFGSGFSVYEHGAKAAAMGGAFIAQANDASAVFFNPAGITAIKGTQFGLGVTIIMPSFDFTGPAPSTTLSESRSEKFAVPHLYITHNINEQWSAGFGVYSLFGLGSEWPADWVGRELAVKSDIKTIFFNPVVAFKPVDNFSVSVGVSLVYSDIELNQDYIVPTGDYVGSKLEGSTTGWGFNFGLQWMPVEKLTLGGVYRHNVELKFDEGEATFSNIPAGFEALFPNTKGKADIELPNLIGLGIAYDITDQFTAEFDWMQLGWSSYDKLRIELEDAVAGQTVLEDEKKYEDSYSLRLGLEYRINDSWAVRGGYLRDNNAVPDTHVEPTVPEGVRDLISIGFGWANGSWSVDGYFLVLMQQDREIDTSTKSITGPGGVDVPFNGMYKGSGNLFGITLGYAIN
jgi:long-chain fatty acid transport protein